LKLLAYGLRLTLPPTHLHLVERVLAAMQLLEALQGY
jgi:hypothetical protein